MAKGSINAQSSQRRPGNSQRLVNQARLTPSIVTPTPTPNTSTRVLPISRGSWVCHRCDQICRSISCQLNSNMLRGSSTSRAAVKAMGYQRRWAGRATHSPQDGKHNAPDWAGASSITAAGGWVERRVPIDSAAMGIDATQPDLSVAGRSVPAGAIHQHGRFGLALARHFQRDGISLEATPGGHFGGRRDLRVGWEFLVETGEQALGLFGGHPLQQLLRGVGVWSMQGDGGTGQVDVHATVGLVRPEQLGFQIRLLLLQTAEVVGVDDAHIALTGIDGLDQRGVVREYVGGQVADPALDDRLGLVG